MTVSPPFALQSPALRPAPPAGDPFWDRVRTELDFTIIGAAKSGTSWLYGLLRQHPQLFIPNEQNFFTTYRHLGVAAYDAQYRAQPPGVLLGDYSTSYMLDRALPEAMARRFAGIRVVMLCRHPADRAFSHYRMDLRNGDLAPGTTFAAALADPPQFSYFDFGLYARHLRRWLEHIDAANLHVVLFDQLVAEPAATASRLFEFLGVDPSFDVDPAASNRNAAETQPFHNSAAVRRVRAVLVPRMSDRVRRIVEPRYYRMLSRAFARHRPSGPVMDPVTRVALVDAYRAPNEELRNLVGADVSRWSE